MTEPGLVRAEAFAPAHVTGVFRPAVDARDPRARGSVGAGIVLECGVRAVAEFRPGPRRRIRVSSRLGIPLPISEEVAHRLRPNPTGTLSVHLVHELPVGQGFGMSAAGATATALAVGAISGRPRPRVIEVAHLADLFGGGGLGGVASIVGGGGLEFRSRSGIPPFGRTVHRELSGSVILGVAGGPLPSPRLLRDRGFLRRVATASNGLDDLLQQPGVAGFFDLSERFTDRLGLAPAPLVRVLRGLRRRGASAAQAMFGRSFFARVASVRQRTQVLQWLAAARVPAVELAPARRGAHFVGSA